MGGSLALGALEELLWQSNSDPLGHVFKQMIANMDMSGDQRRQV
jgi:hypothetical protein